MTAEQQLLGAGWSKSVRAVTPLDVADDLLSDEAVVRWRPPSNPFGPSYSTAEALKRLDQKRKGR